MMAKNCTQESLKINCWSQDCLIQFGKISNFFCYLGFSCGVSPPLDAGLLAAGSAPGQGPTGVGQPPGGGQPPGDGQPPGPGLHAGGAGPDAKVRMNVQDPGCATVGSILQELAAKWMSCYTDNKVRTHQRMPGGRLVHQILSLFLSRWSSFQAARSCSSQMTIPTNRT